MIVDEKTLLAVAEILGFFSKKIMSALESDNPERVLCELTELLA